MKKLFSLVLLTLAAFTFTSSAQTNTTCNAGFNFTISGLSVNFTAAITTDLSGNHHYWKFGDGAISSNISPVHLYASGGTYTVKHYFYKSENGAAVCVDSTEKRVELTATSISCNLHASFTFERDPSQPTKVYFHNLSTAANDIHGVKWSFGDGTYSYDYNATHVYATSGLYKVCLIVQKDNTCQRDTCGYVQVQALAPTCNLEAYFAWHTDSIHQNKVYFQNLSSHFEAQDSIRWTFGDGSTSLDINPSHTYALPGIYNVCIRVKKNSAAGTTFCVKEICKQIEVRSACNLQAYFSYQFDPINHNKIYFVNQSLPATLATGIQWNFGDGTTSVSNNPDHTYAHAGTYKVCIRIAAGSACYKEFCKTVEIKDTEESCDDISKFKFTRSTVNCLEFKFVPANQNPNWKYVWNFGDGTRSTDVSPSHVYQHSGYYTVYLTVYRSSTCVSTSHTLAETGACFSCGNIWVKFESRKESPSSNKFYFHTQSNYPVLSQSWTITKLNAGTSAVVTLSGLNPVYLFNEPGDYRVCLRAVTYGNCVKEYCEIIHITAPNAECSLTPYPNPSNNQVTFSLQLSQPVIIHVYIFNSLNILMKHKDQQGVSGNNVLTVNIEDLQHGIYTVKVIYGNRICYSKFQKL